MSCLRRVQWAACDQCGVWWVISARTYKEVKATKADASRRWECSDLNTGSICRSSVAADEHAEHVDVTGSSCELPRPAKKARLATSSTSGTTWLCGVAGCEYRAKLPGDLRIHKAHEHGIRFGPRKCGEEAQTWHADIGHRLNQTSDDQIEYCSAVFGRRLNQTVVAEADSVGIRFLDQMSAVV